MLFDQAPWSVMLKIWLEFSDFQVSVSNFCEIRNFRGNYTTVSETFSNKIYIFRRFTPQVAQARNMSIGERFVWEKTYRFRNLRKWKDFNKKQPTLLNMCVTSLLCGPLADLWPFYGFLCKLFSLYIKVYQGWALHRRPKLSVWV